MVRIYVYRRKFKGTNKPDIFIVKEYANGKYYHHRQFYDEELANKYAATAIPKSAYKARMLKDYPSSKDNLRKILGSDRYTQPKRRIV